MKKSNKTTIFYILSSVFLFVCLLGGGIYGVYLSIGLSFVRNGISNMTGENVARNVSFGGSVNFSYSMIGVIILSIFLIIISIFDFILLIKQITFFKQFKVIRESKIEQKIEKKIKNKTSIIIFTFIVDIIAFLIGIIGIIINSRTFPQGGSNFMLNLIDGLVSLFSLISIILLIAKLKNKKSQNNLNNIKNSTNNINYSLDYNLSDSNSDNFDIDKIEYKLLKLKQLKSSKIINSDEYEKMRHVIIGVDNDYLEDNLQDNKINNSI